MPHRPLAILLACLCVLTGAAPPASAEDPAPRNATASLAAHEAALAQDPDDFEALLGAANALNREMAERTNGNLPLVDGLQDGDANRALWAELGPRALGYARRAHALRPDSVEAAAALANAYMFYASSLGILSAILRGSAGEYREHAQRLVAMDPAHEDGLGDYLLASYYLVAPWPIGDAEAALRHYRRAAMLSPESVRNQYGLAVYFAREGEEAKARRHFDRVVGMACRPNTEQLFCDFMKREARRARDAL